MKKDVAAIVAVGVAILVMVAAVVLGFAGPARAAEEDLYLGTAERRCQQALASLENRSWQGLIEQLTVPGEERASLSLSVMPMPEGQAPRSVRPQDILLTRTSRAGGDTVVYQTENGAGWCIATAYSGTERDGEMVPDWTVTSVVLAGTGEVRRGVDVIARK